MQERNLHTDKYTNSGCVTSTNGTSQYRQRLNLTTRTRPQFKRIRSTSNKQPSNGALHTLQLTNTNRCTNIEHHRYEYKTITYNRQTHGHEHAAHIDKHTPNPHTMPKPLPNYSPPRPAFIDARKLRIERLTPDGSIF